MENGLKVKKNTRRSKDAQQRRKERYLEILKRRESHKKEDTSESKKSGVKAKKVCKYYYRSGHCHHGDNCRFSHDCVPLTSKDLKLCQFFIKIPSECKFTDEECKYSHDPTLFLCRQKVVTGTCSIENRCPFIHKSPEELLKMDDTEKLKFCYNNKKYLVTDLVKYLNGINFTNLVDRSGKDEVMSIVKRASEELTEEQIAAMPWYLQFILMVLEKDLESHVMND